MVEKYQNTVPSKNIRLLNLPVPVVVKENALGLPVMIKMQRWEIVESINDRWRIDDEWWRREPVSRLYYAVVLKSGKQLLIYKDLISNAWYYQH